ncbi:MAG TPA: glutathione S-transferase N-terminal domain-containing protein [Thermoleophilaceae bacterium]
MATRLYVIAVSNPSSAAAAMIAHKRIPHRRMQLLPGAHPVLVRLAGFRRWTVPALDVDGRKVQGSRAISRALDELRPDPPLHPADPELRRAVVEAERWGESELQPVPRQVFRWLLTASPEMRRWFATEIMPLPAPAIGAPVAGPVARMLLASEGADERTVRDRVARLPALLDRVDALIAAGTIGGEAPNAADFQIGASVRVLLEFEDLRGLVEGRPCASVARQLFRNYPGPVPRGLPPEWLGPQLREGSAGIVASRE